MSLLPVAVINNVFQFLFPSLRIETYHKLFHASLYLFGLQAHFIVKFFLRCLWLRNRKINRAAWIRFYRRSLWDKALYKLRSALQRFEHVQTVQPSRPVSFFLPQPVRLTIGCDQPAILLPELPVGHAHCKILRKNLVVQFGDRKLFFRFFFRYSTTSHVGFASESSSSVPISVTVGSMYISARTLSSSLR